MDAAALHALLTFYGVNLEGITVEDLTKHVTETLVIKKYATEGPADRTDEPFETLTFKNGELTEIRAKRLPDSAKCK